jgi:uncharacterized protein (TIGR03083 family)
VNDVLERVLADLTAEGDALRAAVVDADAWSAPTPAPGWDVATQIAHLLWTDEVAVLAAGSLTDEGKQAWDELVLQAIDDPTGYVDKGALELAQLPTDELLARWDAGRTALAAALRGFPDGQKMPWFGPPMSPTSMATARFMETWAHALDVYDALGSVAPRPAGGRHTDGTAEGPDRMTSRGGAPTDRIRHVAHIGVRTRNFSFAQNGLEPPTDEFRIELTAPSGETWTWGPADAAQRVSGPAYDFCRLVTQRIHRDDTDLRATGDDAEQWLRIAQCFAGPPGEGRESGATT